MFNRCGRIASLVFLLFMLPVSTSANAACDYLMKGLVFQRHLSSGNGGIPAGSSGILYVLGGRQYSLDLKIRTAGRLYAEGGVAKIFFLHRPGITEFAPSLGRNYTNDEWATVQLKKEGIGIDSVEFVTVAPAFFATFAEARTITALARERGARRLVLVTSRHHTERVRQSFSHFNRDNRLDLYVYGTEENSGFADLLTERIKLLVYRWLVFPASSISSPRTPGTTCP